MNYFTGLFLSSKASFIIGIIFFSFLPLYSAKNANTKKNSKLSVLSYNLKGWKHELGKPNKTIKLIKKFKYDILAFQEYTPYFKKKLKFLKRQYKYQILYPKRGAYGYAIYSKRKLYGKKFIQGKRKGYAALCTAIGNQRKNFINICNVHFKSQKSAFKLKWSIFKSLSTNEKIREDEWNLTRNWCNPKKTSDGCIILGDFNTGSGESLYGRMRRSLNDSMSEIKVIEGNTYPNPKISNSLVSWIRIDFIFNNKKIKPIKGKTISGGGSDHLPVYIQFSL